MKKARFKLPFLSPKRPIILLASILIILLVVTSAYLTRRNYKLKQQYSDAQQTKQVINWKIYKFSALNLEFQLSKEVFANRLLKYSKGELVEKTITGSSGTRTCVGFDNKYDPSYHPCRLTHIFAMVASSPDFTLNSHADFKDTKGYLEKNGQFYTVFKTDSLIEGNAEEIINPNGIKILIIRGSEEESGFEISPPKRIQALINAPQNPTYPAITIEMDLNEEKGLTEDVFEQILFTFQFLD